MGINVQCHDYPPPGHSIARFPFLYWPPQAETYAIYTLWDSWRFTTTWTLVLYAIFHLAAAVAAIVMQIGKTRSTWKFIWAVPLVYALIAGFEATIAGSVVGLVLGAVYRAGCYPMSTWIPFIWAWINVLVLVVSSFTMQGGL